jgi:hypothetical protein
MVTQRYDCWMPNQIHLKIQRANKHFGELHEVIATFKEGSPYRVAKKRDPKTVEHVIYIHSADPLPETIPLIAGDVIQNLYSSLDYLAWQLAINPTNTTAFPISQDIPTTPKQIARYEGQVCGMRMKLSRSSNG